MVHRKFKSGQGGFVTPPQGRPAVGALPGETTEDRDRRVLALAQAHPDMKAPEVAKRLGVPLKVAKHFVHRAKEMRRDAAKPGSPAQFLPVQLFTPGPPVPPTAAERLAAVPDDVKAEIAARYGAKFKT